MPDQNYSNHRQYVPIFHRVLLPVLFLTVIGSIVNLVESWGDPTRLYSASLIVVLSVCGLFTAFFARVFSLKAQDRAIRAEENLRHFAMTGKLLDARLTVRQVVALRFASDGEFVALAQRAAAENLTSDAIKNAIKTWRPDTYRV
jgi:NADH:ubiquinone oxidoreductase subunit 2 (subunit N)